MQSDHLIDKLASYLPTTWKPSAGQSVASTAAASRQSTIGRNQFNIIRPRSIPRYPDWQSAFSEDAMRRAWQPVRAKKGAANGESVLEFEQKLDRNLGTLRQTLLRGDYRPKPVKQILIPKRDDKWRPITLWTVRDRVAQRAVYNYLEPIWEARFLNCNHGYRTGFSTHTAAEAIQQAYADGMTWVWDADIKDCFGTMRDKTVVKRMREWRVPDPMQSLISDWLQTRIQNAWGKRKRVGTSQGGVISPLLCNLYLHSLDRAMQQRRWRLVRYADDLVVMAQSKRATLAAARHASHTLTQLSLEINSEKTSITHFEEGFAFVGWFFVRNEAYRIKK